MKQPFCLNKHFLIAIFVFASLPFFAQNSTLVQLSSSNMRVPIDVPSGQSTITMKGLIPGNTYMVRAARAVQGQLVTLELAPSAQTAATAEQVTVLSKRKNSLHFTATAEQVNFTVIANSQQFVTSVPMYLSVHCETCEPEKIKKNAVAESLANLQTVSNISAQSLISNTLIGGDCFTISNVTTVGNPLARGTFSNGTSNIGIGSGMVMSTGNVNILPGPNNQDGANGGFGTGGDDADLSSLVDGELNDINIIEFDFTPTANTVQFDFIFGSEEYCEYVNSEYNDVFGFFISGPGIAGKQNLAIVPGSGGLPVTINNVNHVINNNYYVNNNVDFLSCPFQPALYVQECQLDGWTTLFTAEANVIPCSTYHIKLAIADVFDEFFDSAVFFRANSFNAGGTVSASPAYQDDLTSAYEGCAEGAIRFARGNGDLSQDLTVNFAVSPASTATEGVDYAPLVSPVLIPAGQSEVLVPVIVFADGIPEGPENIRLLIDNSCQCQQEELNFSINDKLLFTASIAQDTTICEGFSVTLTAGSDDGVAPYTYDWSTGDTTQSILVSPILSTLYTVTITDACGGTATDDALVEVIPIFRNTINAVICPGGSFEINGVFYTMPGTVMDTSYEIFLCGRITTYNITLSSPAAGSDTLTFCEGASVEIGGQIYTQAGTVLDTLSTAAGCDSIVTHTLVVIPRSIGAETITFCPGDFVELGGFSYNLPGTVILTLTAASGCDSVVTYTLIELPTPTRTEIVSFCPGDSIVLGGVTYTQAATVTLTIAGIQGCDTLVTYKLELLPEPTRAETIRFCVGDTVTLGGNTYTQPGMVTLKLPASVGCDTIVTYTLQYLTPALSIVSITCPNSISVNVPSGTPGTAVIYHDATASSDCPCPGITITQSSGLISGSTFPLGVSQVCYKAQDVCGQTKTCCFNVSVEEENPCDVKVIGCMKYELLTITQDQYKNKTYRVRVTNNCPNELVYTAIQTPSGIVAMAPANNSTYTAPSGNEYLIRNPNYSPFYSVRYRALGAGIANGESDILRYTLPAQADVLFIHIMSRLSIQVYYEAHLNTFYCPIGVTPQDERSDEIPAMLTEETGSILVFPNPSDGSINVDLAAWEGQKVQMQVFNSQGQRVWLNTAFAAIETQRIDLPQGIADGLYILDVSTEAGEKEVIKFVIKH